MGISTKTVTEITCDLFDLPTKAERLAALRALPDSIRPLVETEYRRIFTLRAEK